ncbi:glutathione S-transferase/RNA polymerase-associated protein [Phenylobacterium haematophilum]|uniref:Glutathione S-transferase/RNA polymerase-associated protein n=1 Tax=Phenylobacterium haematophilum TaxID=98513 RepID=A0A840A1S6_9CAUL|nr:glutathione S-transferase family protein [Phenylobacterium haematophilum]MBB3891287.1 glutathione S-transferase/RNA polymerase-associated protein [Phenylobacterium haematophilum]
MLKLYDHPLSPYAQKVKIALREKGQPFETLTPGGLGAGGAAGEFLEANPRAEVPALVDGEVRIFDSTIILEYVEDRWPDPPLLPAAPAERARVRMLEEAMDTHFEAINWGLSEIRWFRRTEGELERTLLARAAAQTRRWFGWLESQLDDRPWFNGETFGWGDLAVAPYLNGSVGHGLPPDKGSKLAAWLERANARSSVARTAEEAAASSRAATMPNVAELVRQGLFKREYRDHRLEWMIKSGGAQVVIDGLAKDNIRFSPDFGPRPGG